MALQKTFPLFGGQFSASYVSYSRIEVMDDDRRVAQVMFALHVDKAAADAGKPPVDEIRLRVEGDKYDLYFSKAQLAQKLVIAQCYVAAKAETVDMSIGSGLLLSDAQDV